jgi:hypothetical protein
VKGYNLPVDYVLYDMSYANMIMFGAVIPSYNSKRKGKDGKEQEIIKVDDPQNRERVKEIFDQFD